MAVDSAMWIAQQWQGRDMTDFIISRIASTILDNFDRLEEHRLSTDDRYKLFAITCLYYPDNSILALKPLIKLLKPDLYFFSTFDFTTNIEYFRESTADYQYILKLSNDIDVLEKKHTNKLKILCNTLKHFNILPADLISVNSKNMLDNSSILQDYIRLIEKAGLKVVLILDGIDEVPMFGILSQKCSADPFKAVIKSIKPLLDMATTQLIQLILFVPDCPGVNIMDILPEWRDTKILHFSLNWNQAALNDYANSVLGFLQSKQGWIWGHSLPQSFAELVGGNKCAGLFFKNVSNPRQFNDLFSKFILQLNLEKNMYGTQNPFIGSHSCSTIENTINTRNNSQSFSKPTQQQERSEL